MHPTDLQRLLVLAGRLPLSESSEPARYFWGSRTPFNIGTVLKARMPKHHDRASARVDQLLTMFKAPSIEVGRACVYLVDAPDADLIERAGGYSNYIYEVVPHGPVYRRDVGWWSRILMEVEAGHPPLSRSAEYQAWADSEVRPLATAYWDGTASERPIWEFCTASVTIAAQIGGP